MNTKQMINERINQIFAYQDSLVESWEPFLNAVSESVQEEQGREITDFERRNIAQCLENAMMQDAAKKRGTLFEETTADDISFLGIQLPVISALLPLEMAA